MRASCRESIEKDRPSRIAGWTRRQSVGWDKRSGLQFWWGGAGSPDCARAVRTLKESPLRPTEPWFCPLDPPYSLPTNRDGQEKGSKR